MVTLTDESLMSPEIVARRQSIRLSIAADFFAQAEAAGVLTPGTTTLDRNGISGAWRALNSAGKTLTMLDLDYLVPAFAAALEQFPDSGLRLSEDGTLEAPDGKFAEHAKALAGRFAQTMPSRESWAER